MDENISLMEKADWLEFRKDKSDQKMNGNIQINASIFKKYLLW